MVCVDVLITYWQEATKKWHENLSHSRRSQCQNMYLEPPAYKAGVPRNGSWRSGFFLSLFDTFLGGLSLYSYRDTTLNMRMKQSRNSKGCHCLKVRSTACASDARSQLAVCVQTGRRVAWNIQTGARLDRRVWTIFPQPIHSRFLGSGLWQRPHLRVHKSAGER